jgi:tyrosyl-tRNA synthetase
MFRYYELLTDKSMSEIAQLRARVASGGLHPMEAKMDLARLIISDFHSSADAARAAEEFTRVVRRGEDPAEMQSFSIVGAMRLDKLLAHTRLAASVSEAARKVKEGAVELNHARASAPQLMVTSGEHTLRLGRKFCRVVVA